MSDNKSNTPETGGVPQRIQVLRILEKMYDGKFWNIHALGKATALNDQVVRRALDDMMSQQWVEKAPDANRFFYRLTHRALARESRAAINKINEIVGAQHVAPEKDENNAR